MSSRLNLVDVIHDAIAGRSYIFVRGDMKNGYQVLGHFERGYTFVHSNVIACRYLVISADAVADHNRILGIHMHMHGGRNAL
jgi:hypothetical protein